MVQSLVNLGMRAVTSGVSPVGLNIGMKKAARVLSDEVTEIGRVSHMIP